MRAQTTLLCGALLATAAAVAVPAAAQAPQATKPHGRIHVTGHRLPLRSYLAQGLDVRQAQVQAQLDELAHEGLDKVMLTRSAAAMDTVVLSSSSDAPAASVFLSEGGRLTGRTNAVLEERYIPVKDKQVVQLIARNGLTGAILWSRKDTLDNDGFQVAVPAAVGARGQAGVILLRNSFKGGGGRVQTLIGLDGRGKQVWTRGLTDSATKTSSGYSFSFTLLQFGLKLRGGPAEIGATRVLSQYDDAGSGTSSGSVTFGAVSQATGAVRLLGGGLSSPDGAVTGSFVSDHSGDGYDDVAAVDGGSKSRVLLSRGVGGTKIWERTDIAANGYGYLEEVGTLTGAKASGAPVEDLALSTAPQPGVVGDPLGLVPDPTSAAHGSVALLSGGTGATVWSRTGDSAYTVQSVKGAPALGVVTDQSSTSATSSTAKLQLDVLDVAGTTLWSQTATLDVSHSATSQDTYFAFAFAAAIVDLDEDKGYEGIAFLDVVDLDTNEEHHQVSLYRSADGSAVKDAESDFFGGSVTGKGEDRTRVTVTKQGVTVALTHGVQGTPLFTRLLPRTAGATSGYLYGYRLGAARCEDGLFGAGGKNHGVVGVLASNGQPRWVVSRVATDQALGTVVAPKTAPHPSC